MSPPRTGPSLSHAPENHPHEFSAGGPDGTCSLCWGMHERPSRRIVVALAVPEGFDLESVVDDDDDDLTERSLADHMTLYVAAALEGLRSGGQLVEFVSLSVEEA